MPKNNPVNETKTSPYDPHQWTRLEYNSIPIYVNLTGLFLIRLEINYFAGLTPKVYIPLT